MSTSSNDHMEQKGNASLKRKAADAADETRQSRRRRTDATVAPAAQPEPLVPSSQPSSSRKRAYSDENEESDAALSNPSSAFDARPRKHRRTNPPSTVQDEAPGPSTRPRGTKRSRDFDNDDDEAVPAGRAPSAGLHWEPEDLVGARPAPHAPQEISPPPEVACGSRAGRRRAQKKRRRLASRTEDEEDEKEVLAILFPPLPPLSSEGGSDRWSVEPASVSSSQREATPTPPQALAPAPAPVPAPIPVPTPSEQVAEWAVDSMEDTLARISRMAGGTQWLQDARASGSSRRRPRR